MSMEPEPPARPRGRRSPGRDLGAPGDARLRTARAALRGPPIRVRRDLAAKLVLARGAEATGGGKAVRLTREKRHVCLGRYPHREHHCVITFTGGGMRVGQHGATVPARRVPDQRRPLGAQRQRAGLATSWPSAARRRAARSHRTVAGSTRSSTGPRTSPDRGRRRRRTVADQPPSVRREVPGRLLETPERPRREGPARRRGARRSWRCATCRTTPARPRSSILADSPTAIQPGADRAPGGAGRGVRCRRRTGSTAESHARPAARCKVGVARLAEDARNGQGNPVPLFVNLIMASEAKHDTGFNPNQQREDPRRAAGSRS